MMPMHEDKGHDEVGIGGAIFTAPASAGVVTESATLKSDAPAYILHAWHTRVRPGVSGVQRAREVWCVGEAGATWHELQFPLPGGPPSMLATWLQEHRDCGDHRFCVRRALLLVLCAEDEVYHWKMDACTDAVTLEQMEDVLRGILASFRREPRR